MRMLAAIIASLVFTFAYGALAAKSRRAETGADPASRHPPVRARAGISLLHRGRLYGAGARQRLRRRASGDLCDLHQPSLEHDLQFLSVAETLPGDLDEATRRFRLSPWQRFWRLEVPFSMPGLVWNTMMSMSGGWFFVVASEAISVGNTTVTLPGVGSYVALAIDQQDLIAVAWAVAAMLAVVLIYDQLLFRPLVAWGDKFRVEQSAGGTAPRSCLLDAVRRTRLLQTLLAPSGPHSRACRGSACKYPPRYQPRPARLCRAMGRPYLARDRDRRRRLCALADRKLRRHRAHLGRGRKGHWA